MRWNNLYVAGLGACYPDTVETPADAIAAGRYTEAARAVAGYREVRTAGPGQPGPVLAAVAARQAAERAGVTGEDVDLVLHAYVGHQGLDFWTPASFVQNESVGGTGIAVEVRQGCNGGLAALELAASHLSARPGASAALVTAGDTFRLPYVDRWSAGDQVVYGDGAAALVLSRQGGFARLLATVSVADPTLEPMERGTGGWADTPFPDGKPIDLGARKREFLAADEDGYDEVIEKITRNAVTVLDRALAESGTDKAGLAHFVHQNLPETIAGFSVYGLLGMDRATTVYDWGLTRGQMGAADELAGLNQLVEAGRPQPGDRVAVMGVGAGYVWTVAVLEFLDLPAW
ncbi:ketoacyl-ACP synthase III family protein [Streptomyces sp. JJ66]|uniref:ketoacyl-ACP synthase III family protein n=1 Tax=Streptomyces sp. JJ66 TaxID=2803843 RepID=UPI001C5862FD|nr:ketoacyl-ACP synthase III family protein [Streptomyces sp. JJ66]MBW1602504.1 ketoacyl-ACP synthase III family protein [Streptomyces sp. JJ66]